RKASSVHSRRRSVIVAKFMGKPGVRQKFARRAIVLVVDEDTPLQQAEGAFDDAHVLVQDHVMDFGAVEQRANRGNQNEVVGSNQFPQTPSPFLAAPGAGPGMSTVSGTCSGPCRHLRHFLL